ncbi:MAG: hypothetical protein AAF441_10100 [Pseudomonadota bacterium]
MLVEDQYDPDRWFVLSNVADADYESEGFLVRPGTVGSGGGFFADRRLDDVPSLELGISWHDQGLDHAFELYRFWMIERKSAVAVEARKTKLRFNFPLSGCAD